MFFDLIIFVSVGIGFGFFWVWITKPLERQGWRHYKKLHFHHTVLGLAILILGIVVSNYRISGFGIGIILHHFITEGPQFITRD